MKALWIDNDLGYVEPYRRRLLREGWTVNVTASVSDGERLLRQSADEPYDLLILDVMLPTVSEAEEAAYPPYSTNAGIETGLVLMQRTKHLLTTLGTSVLVMTVRLDADIRHRFEREGFPPDSGTLNQWHLHPVTRQNLVSCLREAYAWLCRNKGVPRVEQNS